VLARSEEGVAKQAEMASGEATKTGTGFGAKRRTGGVWLGNEETGMAGGPKTKRGGTVRRDKTKVVAQIWTRRQLLTRLAMRHQNRWRNLG
jgi:hypothetical protein